MSITASQGGGYGLAPLSSQLGVPPRIQRETLMKKIEKKIDEQEKKLNCR